MALVSWRQFHSEEPHVPARDGLATATIEMAVTAIQQGAYDFIEKPFKSDRLLLVVRRALEAAALARENAELRLRVGPETSLTGDSSAIGVCAPASSAWRRPVRARSSTGLRVAERKLLRGWCMRGRAAPMDRSLC